MDLQQVTPGQGELYLVSAGIGDAENITLKALHVIQRADLILAMPFVQQQLSEYLPAGVEVIDPGHGLFTELAKRGNKTALDISRAEQEIREHIRQAVARGECVAVLEFGDPTLFGPQSGYLTEFADLNPLVIAGISSFNAANAVLAESLLGDQNRTMLLSGIHGLDDIGVDLPDVLVLFTMRMQLPELSEKLLSLYTPHTLVNLVFFAGFAATQQSIAIPLHKLATLENELDIPWECLMYIHKNKTIS